MSRDSHPPHTILLSNVYYRHNTKKSEGLNNHKHQSDTFSSISLITSPLGGFPFSSPYSPYPFPFPPHPSSSPCFFASYYISLINIYFAYPSPVFHNPQEEGNKRKEKEKKRTRYPRNKRTREEKREGVEERAGGREGNLPQSKLILRLKMNQPTVTLNYPTPTQSYI